MNDTTTLIAIPCLDVVPTAFMCSIACMRRVGKSKISVTSNSLVHMARNMLAAQAIDLGVDRVLWIDSDMQFGPDLMERLSADMDEGMDYVCGLFFKRMLKTRPLIYKKTDGGEQETYWDYPRDRVFRIAGSGFGAVMTSTKLLQDVFDTHGLPFAPDSTYGEDLTFCARAGKLGYEMYCDSRVKVGHVGQYVFGEEYFLSQMSGHEEGGSAHDQTPDP